VLAAAHGVDIETLRTVNAIAGDAVPAGTRLLVPGHADNSRAQATIARVETLIEHSATHVVHAGDTLWSIARSAGVGLGDLLSWNGLHQDATLQLGQRLRLRAPEGASSTASVSAP